MGALRERFWERPLDTLNHAEWEALCDGCGRCCLHKLEDEDTGEIVETNVACTLLDCAAAQCRDYPNRKSRVPDCLRLTPQLLPSITWLPASCAYVRRGQGLALPSWHYLVCGDRDAVVRAGVSVAGRCLSEDFAGPLEHHIVEWADAP